MKKPLIYLTLSALLFCSAGAFAQDGINFEKILFAKALEKAKKEKKPLFIDFHTVWCGPCRMMEKDIFPLKKVGDVYNKQFINMEIDAEKGEGIELAKKYGINSYPSFLFVDGDAKVLYRFMGARDEDSFIKEAEQVSLIAKYGGWNSFMEQYKSDKASPQLTWDYYQLAREDEKPLALNRYLKSLPDEKLFNMATGRFFENLTEFDFDLNQRLVDGLVERNNLNPEYIFKYTFRVQRNISKQFDSAIENGNREELNKLLELKKAFAPISDRNETDIQLLSGRGMLFASPEFISLTYDATNQENFDAFKPRFENYMHQLMTKSAPLDSATKWKEGTLQMLEQSTDYAQHLFYPLSRTFEYTANHILLWTDYYWRNLPTTPELKSRCAEYVNYAYQINPYSSKTPIPAARLMNRLEHTQAALGILNQALELNNKYNRKDLKLIKNIEIAKRDIENGK